jgi:hypothetical protein
MKKVIRIAAIAIVLIITIYYGILRDGFRYFTGIGTPYSYFQAQKAKHDSILVFYEQDLADPVYIINIDSLNLKYGFKDEFGGLKVSYSVMELYNSIIRKELMRRLGKNGWDEYQSKLDSLYQDVEKKSPLSRFVNKE